MKSRAPSEAVSLVSLAHTAIMYGQHLHLPNREFPDKLAKMRPLIKHVVEVEKSREKTHERI